MPTAAALASVPKDPTKIKPHLAADDIAKRVTSLLRDVPEEVRTLAVEAPKPPRAELNTDAYWAKLVEQASEELDVLRVEVSVDTARLDEDPEYRQSLIDDARFAALEFLKPLVRG